MDKHVYKSVNWFTFSEGHGGFYGISHLSEETLK